MYKLTHVNLVHVLKRPAVVRYSWLCTCCTSLAGWSKEPNFAIMKNRPQAQESRRRVWTFRGGVQFLGSTSRQKPSYRHPRARVPMLSMVEYSCTVQLLRTAVICHVINRSVTSSDTSS